MKPQLAIIIKDSISEEPELGSEGDHHELAAAFPRQRVAREPSLVRETMAHGIA